MSAIIDFVEDAVEDVVDFVVEVAEVVWDEVVMPVLTEIMGILGIADEDILAISHVSVRMYQDDLSGIRDTALVKASMDYMRNPKPGILAPFIRNTEEANSKIQSYYTYGEDGYVYALPTTNINAASVDRVAIKNIIDAEIGEPVVLLEAYQYYITADIYYKEWLQGAHDYLPYDNTLTRTDAYGTWDDWTLDFITYNAGLNNWNIDISRIMTVGTFFLSGYSEVTEGTNTLNYTVTVDRLLPAGTSATVNLAYTGTAVDGVDYDQIASVVVPAGSDTITFALTTYVGGAGKSIIVTVDSVSPQDGFDTYAIEAGKDSITTAIVVSATPVLTDNTNMPAPPLVVENHTYVRTPWNVATYTTVTYYTVAVNDPSIWFYWIYDTSLLTHPNIQTKTNRVTNLEIMPMAILRSNFVNASPASIGQVNYDSVVDLVGKLGITYEDLMLQIADPSNPDIDKLKDAFMHFAIDPYDDAIEISKVLYEMWFALSLTNVPQLGETVEGLDPLTQNFVATYNEQDIRRSMVWSKQELYTTAGVLAGGARYSHAVTAGGALLTINKQVSPTDISVIKLHNLSSIEFLRHDGLEDTAITKLGQLDDNSVLLHNFSIPLSYNSVNQLNFMEMLVLFPYALRLDFYAVEVIHLEWYETAAFASLFKIVIIIVAIIVTIFTAGTATAGWVAFAQQLLINYAIAAVAIALIKTLDNPIAQLIVAAVAIYLTWGASGGSTLTLFESSALIVTEFSMYLTVAYEQDILDQQALTGELVEEGNTRYEQIRAQQAALDESDASNPGGIYVANLMSPDTNIYRAIQMQYDFSNTYDYDRLTSNFHSNALTLGVV